MANNYNGIEKYIFGDAYILFTKYSDMKVNDDRWEQFILDANSLYNKYHGKTHKNTNYQTTYSNLFALSFKKQIIARKHRTCQEDNRK